MLRFLLLICLHLSEEKSLDSLLKMFYSGSIYIIFAQENSLKKSAMLRNVSLLLNEEHLYNMFSFW